MKKLHIIKHWKWLAAGAVLGAAAVLAGSAAVTALSPAKHAVIVSGLSLRTDSYEMKIGNTRSADHDPAFTTVPEDDVVIIPVSITNLSKNKVQFFPVLSTYIRDTTGGIYPMHPSLFLKNPMPGQDIAPGATLSGELSYEVPKILKNFKYYIDPGWGDMAPVVFSLKR